MNLPLKNGMIDFYANSQGYLTSQDRVFNWVGKPWQMVTKNSQISCPQTGK